MGGAIAGGGAKGGVTAGTTDEVVKTTGVTVTIADDTADTATAGTGATPEDAERIRAASLTDVFSF